MQKYFFIPGSNPAISSAEICAVLDIKDGSKVKFVNNIIIYEGEIDDPARLISRLGGCVKTGRLYSQYSKNDSSGIIKAFDDLVLLKAKPGVKFNFGFSEYGHTKLNIKDIALRIKTALKEKGVNGRWIKSSKSPALSSVQAEQNRLTRDGLEIVLAVSENSIFVGETIAVQPFKELSFRDYNRPGRDDLSGMLPPKLAQIMINLAKAPLKGSLLDPFCGSGTVLTEAALMGYKHITASDISAKAVDDTKKNIMWIEEKFEVFGLDAEIFELSGPELSKKIRPDSIDAIITEPYLGPQRGRIEAGKIVKELESLYSKSLKEFMKILKKNGRTVMVWPVLNIGKTVYLNPKTKGFRKINPLPETISNRFRKNDSHPGLTSRNTLLYGRPGQRVWREIIVLEK